METKTQNAIQIAKDNLEKLWNITKNAADPVTGNDAKYDMAIWARENESDIAHAAARILGYVESINERMAEVQRRIDTGCIDGLNTCGILQSLNHDLDSDVTKIKTLADNRKFYRNLLK